MKYLLYTTLLIASLTACGSDGDSGPDATPVCTGAVGCNGPCEMGNELGVGRFCTKGGLECADTPRRAAPFCTVDSTDTDVQFCTKPCSTNEDCGTGAICESEDGTGPKGCVPVFCIGGLGDAGVADAGPTTDAGTSDATTVAN